jgi:1-phosphofructokinase family hexose kinase
MILTVTPNPSIDYLFDADTLVWDDANRLNAPRRRPGGQGVNLTRAANALGASSVAVALLGGQTGDELEQFLRAENTPCVRIPIKGETRIFVGVRESDSGRSLLLNPRGPQIDPDEGDAILSRCAEAIARVRPTWVTGCGSLPPGLPLDFYARLGLLAKEAGARFVVDCDGEPLKRAAPHAHLLVPNQHEAARLLNTSIDDLAAVRQAVLRLTELGAANAAITLGEQGAVLSDGTSVWHAQPPRWQRGSAVGAGDAFLAALLHALTQSKPIEECVAEAVAAGTAVLNGKGSDLLLRSELEKVREKIEVRPLH